MSERIKIDIAVVSRTPERVSQLLISIAQSINIPLENIRVICSWNGKDSDSDLIQVPNGLSFEIFLGHKYHFASNINFLVSRSRGQIFCICNDDILLEKETLAEGVRWANKENTGLVGSILLFPNGKIQHLGVDYDPQTYLPFHQDKGELLSKSINTSSPQHYAFTTGALIFVKTKLIKDVLFRESFGECGEDIALSVDFFDRYKTFPVIPKTVVATHLEGFTRSKEGTQGTPEKDKLFLSKLIKKFSLTKPKILMMTEEEGWILHRKCKEIQSQSRVLDCKINEPSFDSDIVYFMHYARYDENLAKNKISVANFTHIVPGTNTEQIFKDVAHKVDHCISISQETTKILRSMGVESNKISTVVVGASNIYKPKLVLGLVGRPYGDGRKGEDLVLKLLNDPDLDEKIHLVSTNNAWNVTTIDTSLDSFYHYIDYLLVPSRFEGGPVPFMEALRCGKMSIAPPIGVIPSFPYEPYDAGSYESMKKTILSTYTRKLLKSSELLESINGLDWEGWVYKHESIFLDLLRQGNISSFDVDTSSKEIPHKRIDFTKNSLTAQVYSLISLESFLDAQNLLDKAYEQEFVPKALYDTLSLTIQKTSKKK